jgi:hypothetical protein
MEEIERNAAERQKTIEEVANRATEQTNQLMARMLENNTTFTRQMLVLLAAFAAVAVASNWFHRRLFEPRKRWGR